MKYLSIVAALLIVVHGLRFAFFTEPTVPELVIIGFVVSVLMYFAYVYKKKDKTQ